MGFVIDFLSFIWSNSITPYETNLWVSHMMEKSISLLHEDFIVSVLYIKITTTDYL